MVSLEQVKLLENKVTKMIDYVKKVNEENLKLKETLDSYEKRTGELEVLFQRFKDDQNRIEDGILSALDLLNKFEDAVDVRSPGEAKVNEAKAVETPPKEVSVKDSVKEAPVILEAEEQDTDEEDDAISSEELDIF